MIGNNDTIRVIDKLVELTQHKRLKWKRENPPESIQNKDNKIDFIYTTEYLGKTLRAYEKQEKSWMDEQNYTWSTKSILEFVDHNGKSLAKIPRSPNLNELIKEIQFQDQNIADFFKKMLTF